MAIFLLVSAQSYFTREREKMRIIYLIPIGEVNQDLILYLSQQIQVIFPFSVKIKEPLPHPGYAYNTNRDQYESDLILKELEKADSKEVEKILGVVDLDLYTPGLNFVFGQAVVGGKTALIALARLKQQFYGLPEDKNLYYSRAIKEAVHELGHTFGLSHCKNPKCVMHFSNSLADTDYKDKFFCENCRNKLPFKSEKK